MAPAEHARFRVLVTRALSRCAELGVLTYIANVLVGNPGVPSQDDARWVAAGCGDLSPASGIVAVVTVNSGSTVASLGTKRLRESADAHGGSVHQSHRRIRRRRAGDSGDREPHRAADARY